MNTCFNIARAIEKCWIIAHDESSGGDISRCNRYLRLTDKLLYLAKKLDTTRIMGQRKGETISEQQEEGIKSDRLCETDLEIYARQGPHRTFDIYLFRENAKVVEIATKIKWEAYDEHKEMPNDHLHLTLREAQRLADELWRMGIRPEHTTLWTSGISEEVEKLKKTVNFLTTFWEGGPTK